MARKKIKALLDKKKSGIRQWTYEVVKTSTDYCGKVKDEKGRVVFEVIENIDYNVLSRLLNTNKYMSHEHDMKGLAKYLWDRGLVPMDDEEKEDWKKKKIVPVELKEIKK
jgi:hypothetical protein